MINSGWIAVPVLLIETVTTPRVLLNRGCGHLRGMCSLDCERLCPDRDNLPVTFVLVMWSLVAHVFNAVITKCLENRLSTWLSMRPDNARQADVGCGV